MSGNNNFSITPYSGATGGYGDTAVVGEQTRIVAVEDQHGNQVLGMERHQAIVTDQGVAVVQTTVIHHTQSAQDVRGQPAIVYMGADEPELETGCCACNLPWYSLRGKGCIPLIFLLLFYLVFGVIALVLYCICCCLCGRNDD